MKQKLVNGRWMIWTTDEVADWDGGTGDPVAKRGWEYERFQSFRETLTWDDVFFDVGTEHGRPQPFPGPPRTDQVCLHAQRRARGGTHDDAQIRVPTGDHFDRFGLGDQRQQRGVAGVADCDDADVLDHLAPSGRNLSVLGTAGDGEFDPHRVPAGGGGGREVQLHFGFQVAAGRQHERQLVRSRRPAVRALHPYPPV